MNIWQNVDSWFYEHVIQPISNLFSNLWANIVSGALGAFNKLPNSIKIPVKNLINVIITMVNTLISGINSILSPLRTMIIVIGKVLGKNWTLNTISIPKIPYLAKGGIVNNPGPGVMMGSYIAGEKGPEAVIPLDDETLDRLGLAFARHTIINATLINQMNGRVISREIQKINAENDFAYNR